MTHYRLLTGSIYGRINTVDIRSKFQLITDIYLDTMPKLIGVMREISQRKTYTNAVFHTDLTLFCE
jgi:hypothetical protein